MGVQVSCGYGDHLKMRLAGFDGRRCTRTEESGACSSGKMSLLSCGPEQSFVTLPEIESPWDVQQKAQGHLNSQSEGFPASQPAWDGNRPVAASSETT